MFGHNGCDYCNDLRNIEPAKYVAVRGDDELEAAIQEARNNKQFILHDEDGIWLVEGCHVCGHIFTEEDYDSYWD